MGCTYCDNARINDELEENNDMSIITLGYNLKESARLCFISGNNKPPRITLEIFKNDRWSIIIIYYPSYCPICGRKIIEYIDTDTTSFN